VPIVEPDRVPGADLKQELDRQVTLLLKQAADKAIELAVNAIKKQIAELIERYLVPRMR
jgi:predicted site-specific integrase-resolvase